jgi:hypothetical protein
MNRSKNTVAAFWQNLSADPRKRGYPGSFRVPIIYAYDEVSTLAQDPHEHLDSSNGPVHMDPGPGFPASQEL